MKPRPRILSGVQPSGSLHLGNYFGAIRRHVAMQEEGECFYFIADYHALTSLRDPAALANYTRDVALTYLSVGLDPQRSVFYRQSDIPEVTELAWLLATVTGMGLLERAHSYKEKVARGISASVGLFTYPVLMAADILGPQSDLVPVGQDQDQHVEMTRDMAQLFNNAFCANDPVFRLPAAKIGDGAARVPGTTFEKGTVLHVATAIGLRGSDGGLVDADDYARRFRTMVQEVLAANPEASLRTTEELEVLVAAAHAQHLSGVVVQDRALRVLAENPGEHLITTPRQGGLGLEFYMPLDRVLFLTKEGRRQAAKMSKSQGNTIPIFDEGKSLKKKVMGTETRLVELADPLDWREDIVIQLYELFATPEELAEMRANYERGGFGFGNAKKALLEKIEAHMGPFRERRKAIEADASFVDDVLREGAKKARNVIAATTERARAACGLGKVRR
ncbi:MAG: tryptophan--tRNA ligase [Planctomycetes bacterium]|jgi:tryptophanyl-tRNA synthetase|nr:tryptophan--tRNA ligase [Planctomycetota bacterium]